MRTVETDEIGAAYCEVPNLSSGPYRILTWADDGAVGAFGLHAWRVNDPVGCVELGSLDDGFGPLVGRLSDPGELDCYRGTSHGGTLALTTSNDDSPAMVPRVVLARSNGLLTCAVVGSGSCTLSRSTYSIIVGRDFSLPVFTGRYRVVGASA